jgi:hypothetical protein
LCAPDHVRAFGVSKDGAKLTIGYGIRVEFVDASKDTAAKVYLVGEEQGGHR